MQRNIMLWYERKNSPRDFTADNPQEGEMFPAEETVGCNRD